MSDEADRQSHWEQVYATKGENELSWTEGAPTVSLDLIRQTGVSHDASIIDVGGGSSHLVDALLEDGFQNITVLDLSPTALDAARRRLGARAEAVIWIVADATVWRPKDAAYDLWHDRAAFHFLVDPQHRAAYVERMKTGLRAGGHAVIGAFALDGPERCSGLPIIRYSPDTLATALGPTFALIADRKHLHATPWGTTQSFQFSVFRRL